MTFLTGVSVKERRASAFADPLFIAGIVFILIFVAYPMAAGVMQVRVSDLLVTFSADNREALVNTLLLTLFTVIPSTLIAVPLAWVCARTDLPGKGVLIGAVSLSYVVPVLLTSLSYIFMFGKNSGLVNSALAPTLGGALFNAYSFEGVVLVSVLHSYPLIFLTTLSGLSRMNPELEEAGRICGMSSVGVALRVTLGAVLPSIIAGIAFVIADALTMLAAPLLLGTPVGYRFITTDLFTSIALNPNIPLAVAMSAPLIGFTCLLLWLQRRILQDDSGSRFAIVGGKSQGSSLVALGALRVPVAILAWIPIFLSLILPVVILFLVSLMQRWWAGLTLANMSLAQYAYIFNDPTSTRAIINSAATAFGCGLLMSVGGAALAIALGSSKGRAARLLYGLAEMPLGVPHVVAGVVIIIAWYGAPFYLGGSIVLLVFGYVFVSLPYALKTCRAAYGQIDTALGEAAEISGASLWQTRRLIVGPLIKNGMATTFVLTSLFILKEFSLTVMIYSADSVTIPVRIYQFMDGGSFEKAAASAVILLLVTASILAVAARTLGLSVTNMKV